MKRSIFGLLMAILLLPTNTFAAVCSKTEKTLYNEIKTHTSSTGYRSIVDNFVGISETEEKGETVYLYTGKNGDSEPDNYAVIGDKCFRILRTTYTKGVKLLYYGDYTDNKCVDNSKIIPYEFPSEGWQEDDGSWGQKELYHLSYMHGRNAPTNLADAFKPEVDSQMKTRIDNWYKNNMLDYSEWFEDAIYCNNKEIGSSWRCGTSEGDAYSWDYPDKTFEEMCYGVPTDYTGNLNTVNVYFRNYDLNRSNATLACSKNDSYTYQNADGNQALKYKVGTLSGDEIYFTKSNDYTWIQEGIYAASPQWYDSSSMGMSSLVTTNYSEWKFYLLPVVSVKELTYVVSGTGKKTEPYILSNEICKPEPTPEPVPDEPETTTSPAIKNKVEENPPTGVYNYIWLVPIIVLAGYIAYEVIKNKRHFKSN